MHLYLIRITITKSPNISLTPAFISYQNHNYQITKNISLTEWPASLIFYQNHNYQISNISHYQINKYILHLYLIRITITKSPNISLTPAFIFLSGWQLPNHQIYHKCLHLYLIRITITKSPNISLTPALISYQNHNYQITEYIINSCIYILSESQLPNHQIYH